MNEIQAVKTAKIEEVKKNSKKGFTLVELVVVIAILAILAAIAIPVVSSTIASSQRSSALSDAQTLELALKEAHAQIIAKDTSVYQATATVNDVISKKSLQGIKITDVRSIGGTDYTLKWCECRQRRLDGSREAIQQASDRYERFSCARAREGRQLYRGRCL